MTIAYAESDLKVILGQLDELAPKFSETPMLGPRLDGKDIGRFKQLVLEAVAVLRSEFSASADHYSGTIAPQVRGGIGPNPAELETVCGVIRAAISQLVRVRSRPAPIPEVPRPVAPYVSPARIEELRNSPDTKWDTRRLVRMLEELNEAHARAAHLTVAMLLRAIKDHVPPIFDQPNFAAVAANHSPGGGKAQSWKAMMGKLEDQMKHVADMYLHQQIRAKESIPEEPGVDFKPALDLLLGETARTLR
jgi:hypothetical protein